MGPRTEQSRTLEPGPIKHTFSLSVLILLGLRSGTSHNYRKTTFCSGVGLVYSQTGIYNFERNVMQGKEVRLHVSLSCNDFYSL